MPTYCECGTLHDGPSARARCHECGTTCCRSCGVEIGTTTRCRWCAAVLEPAAA